MGKQNLQLIMFDDGGPFPIDNLFRKMLSPNQDIWYANQMKEQTWCFEARTGTHAPNQPD
jgi:hypothetical protein